MTSRYPHETAYEAATLEALRAENQRLRDALEKFEDAFGKLVDGGCDVDADDASGWLAIARAALKGAE